MEDADRDAALEKLKSKRAKAAEKSQRTRDEFYKSAEENKKKSESDIDSVSRQGDSERNLVSLRRMLKAKSCRGKSKGSRIQTEVESRWKGFERIKKGKR